MSRFFAASDSDSTSDSGSESDDLNVVQEKAQKSQKFNQASFMLSDDEDDTKRVVRSAKEKRHEAMNATIRNIRNCKKIKDFNKMETNFSDLVKAYDKAKAAILKEEGGVTPKFYIRILVEMEDLINETWEDRDFRKAMSKINSKSLGALRQKLRKYIRESPEIEDEMAKFRENPDFDEEGDKDDEKDKEEEEEQEEEEDEVPVKKAAKKKKEKKPMDEDDSDDSYWDSDESDGSSSSDGEYVSLREKFLKRTTEGQEEKKKEKGKGKRTKPKVIKEESEDSDDDDEDGKGSGWIEVDHGGLEKPKMFEKDAEINHDLVVKKLVEIMAARGKKRTNRKEQIELLTELLDISKEHDLQIGVYTKIQFAIIAAIFDYNPKISSAMKADYWEKCLPAIETLLTWLEENIDDLHTGEAIPDEAEVFEQKPYKVRGCYLSCVERLAEEFVKVLKSCDAHTQEYVQRLKDEPRVMEILKRTQKLIEQKQSGDSDLCRIYLKRVEHVYFKFDPKVIEQKQGKLDAKEETSLTLMDKHCKFIYSKDSTDRLRTHAILCHIYHHAIHDNWYEARDLMLMSHLQDTVTHADAATQILYNRTMVQLGLCGFRHAEIRDAHNALLDIQLGGRSKELLAQGLLPQRHHERTTEQEKVEKQRQMPFHMHINLEMLECVYLVSAMLIEIPYMAAHEFDARRRMISKSYYQQLRSSERQALVGPPESMREHVVAASKAMRLGEWKKCRDFIINDKMNAKVWDLFYEADKVRTMLGRKIQEESLRTYLFTYSKVYDSISTATLSEMFSLEKSTVHAIVAKMIIGEELMASLDEPTECMIMHRTEPTRLQSLSLQLSDKIAQLVENNERLLEFRPGGKNAGWQGGWRGKDGNNFGGDRGKGDHGRDDNDNRRGGRGGGRGRGRGGHYENNRNYDNNKYDNRSYENRNSAGSGRGSWKQHNHRE